jgi:hypothetical protein
MKILPKFLIALSIILCGPVYANESSDRSCVIECAETYIGIREKTNNNDGDFIEKLQRSMGFSKGTPYCALFTSYIYRECGILNNPNSAWSPSWFKKSEAVYVKNKRGKITDAKPGDAVTYWRESKGRIGHVGLYLKSHGNYLYTVEANTSDMGDNGNDGIFRSIRAKSTVYAITNFIGE